MKQKLLFLLLFAIFIFSARAQYVFNSCNLHPVFGDSLIGTLQQYDTTGVNSGLAGANITWDYSGLSLTGTLPVYHYYFDPATDPWSVIFSSASVAHSIQGGY